MKTITVYTFSVRIWQQFWHKGCAGAQPTLLRNNPRYLICIEIMLRCSHGHFSVIPATFKHFRWKKDGHEQKHGKRHSMKFLQATKSVVPAPGKDREAWLALSHGVAIRQTRLSY